MTESVLLAGAGGICGVAIAAWTKDLVKLFIPPAPLPIDINPALGTTVPLYALAERTSRQQSSWFDRLTMSVCKDNALTIHARSARSCPTCPARPPCPTCSTRPGLAL